MVGDYPNQVKTKILENSPILKRDTSNEVPPVLENILLLLRILYVTLLFTVLIEIRKSIRRKNGNK